MAMRRKKMNRTDPGGAKILYNYLYIYTFGILMHFDLCRVPISQSRIGVCSCFMRRLSTKSLVLVFHHESIRLLRSSYRMFHCPFWLHHLH
jgi:hypothetical protein